MADTDFLLKEIKKRPYLVDSLKNYDKILSGNSAGALVLCSKFVSFDKPFYLQKGFGIVDISITVHYTDAVSEEISEISLKNKTKIFAINKKSAIKINRENRKIEIFGTVKIFNMTEKWKGVIIEESLTDKSVLDLVKIVRSKKTTLEKEEEKGFLTFHYIELDDKKKDDFVKKALSSIKDGYYVHICRGGVMIVVYKNKMFEFSSNESDKLNQARNYGLSIGILKEQMPFEILVKDPHK